MRMIRSKVNSWNNVSQQNKEGINGRCCMVIVEDNRLTFEYCEYLNSNIGEDADNVVKLSLSIHNLDLTRLFRLTMSIHFFDTQKFCNSTRFSKMLFYLSI